LLISHLGFLDIFFFLSLGFIGFKIELVIRKVLYINIKGLGLIHVFGMLDEGSGKKNAMFVIASMGTKPSQLVS